MTYGFLLESVWHPPLVFCEQPLRMMPPELELQALWFSGAFGREFRTTAGRTARIVQFGEWNRGAGPDFFRAAVELDGEVTTGPIEIDHEPAGWETHGHAENPAFENVILHVVFRDDARLPHTRTAGHREVPRVVISPAQVSDALRLPQRDVAIAYPGRCFSPLKHLAPAAIGKLLEEAALHRAQSKAARFLKTAEAHGRDAALFESAAATLGYRANTLPMRLLAQRSPLAGLRAAPDACEALLFGTAGFLSPKIHEQATEDTRSYLRGLWDTWWKERGSQEISAPREIPWKLHGQRPANHPHRRVGALSALVRHWPGFRSVAFAEPFSSRAAAEFLTNLRHSFWDVHHTLTSQVSPRKIAIIGKSHALELIANHLVPLALAENRISFRDYWKIRSSAQNDSVRRCAIRLFGSENNAAPWTKRLCHHQALLQIYQDFCLDDFSDCSLCPFPEQLAQWK